jgi:hypothetical protein
MSSSRKSNKKSYFKKLLIIGIFGGLFWGTLASLSTYFSFSEVSPRTLIIRTIGLTFASDYYEHLAGIVVISLLSVLYTFCYYLFFKNYQGVFIPVVLGIVVYCLIFLVISKFTLNVPKIQYYGSETFTTILCLFILYSTFIGVSVSYEYKSHKAIRSNYSKNN